VLTNSIQGSRRNVALLLALLSVILSEARGGYVAALIVLAATFVGRSLSRRRNSTAGPALALAIACLVLTLGASVSPTSLLQLSGRESDLSGRTDIWELSLSAASDDWILGYGYERFWASDNPIASSVRESRGWEIPSSHSIYIESLLWGGALGFLSLAAFLLQATYHLVSRSGTPTSRRLAALQLYVLVLGSAENTFPSWNTFFLLMTFLTSTSLARGARNC
jgi:exopolysaccharide production protein ExoQ